MLRIEPRFVRCYSEAQAQLAQKLLLPQAAQLRYFLFPSGCADTEQFRSAGSQVFPITFYPRRDKKHLERTGIEPGYSSSMFDDGNHQTIDARVSNSPQYLNSEWIERSHLFPPVLMELTELF